MKYLFPLCRGSGVAGGGEEGEETEGGGEPCCLLMNSFVSSLLSFQPGSFQGGSWGGNRGGPGRNSYQQSPNPTVSLVH